MSHYRIGCDAHKHYSVFAALDDQGKLQEEQRVNHVPGAIRNYLSDFPQGTPVALESVGNWYWIVDEIEAAGGKPVLCKTGHAFMKERMRREDAVYGGEMSAHHYFKKFAYCDSGMIPWLLLVETLSTENRSLSELVQARLDRYPVSGEINQVKDCTEFMMMLQDIGPGCKSTVGLSNVSNGSPDKTDRQGLQ